MNERKRMTLSTEQVNRYGYRVLTDGIRLDAFLKNPVLLIGHDTWSLPVGRWEDLKKENGSLTGIPVFDENDELGKAVKSKLENGFVFAASINFKALSTSSKAEHLLPGQTIETVTECELMEVSIVTLPGNTDATLSAPSFCLSAIPPLSLTPYNMDLTKINAALGLPDDAPETAALAAIGKLNADRATALAAQTDALIEVGKQNGHITAENEAAFRKLCAHDYESVRQLLSVVKAETTAPPAKPQTMLGMLNGGNPKPAAKGPDDEEEETFEKLQRTNPDRLLFLKNNEPDKYRKLAADYGKGATTRKA